MMDEHFQRLGEFREEIRQRARSLIAEGIDPTLVARAALEASCATNEEHLDSRLDLFEWMQDELNQIKEEFFPERRGGGGH